MKGDNPIHIYWEKKEFFIDDGQHLIRTYKTCIIHQLRLPLEEETRFLQLGKLIFEYCAEEVFAFSVY